MQNSGGSGGDGTGLGSLFQDEVEFFLDGLQAFLDTDQGFVILGGGRGDGLDARLQAIDALGQEDECAEAASKTGNGGDDEEHQF